MVKLKIEVTADDIANGVKEDPACCPMALACKRLGIREPSVGEDVDFITFDADPKDLDEDESRGRVRMPPEAADFVTDFDSIEDYEDDRPDPFAFEIEVPESAIGKAS